MVEYLAGTAKGETEQDTLFNSPFKLGDVDPKYTSEAVVEAVTDTTAAMTLAWTPVVKGAFVDSNEDAKDVKIIAADGTVTYANLDNDGKVPAASLSAGAKIAYRYDNVIIPQAKLPTLKAEIKSIPLLARARRIAVYYSQIAAFQAKTDYGFDLGDQLAEKAVGQLSYKKFVA